MRALATVGAAQRLSTRTLMIRFIVSACCACLLAVALPASSAVSTPTSPAAARAMRSRAAAEMRKRAPPQLRQIKPPRTASTLADCAGNA